MKNILYTVLVQWLILSSLIPLRTQAQTTAPSNNFEILMSKIRSDFSKNPSIEKDLEKYNKDDGSFTDVDYASIARTKWPPMTHIERLSDFAFAYTNPQNKHYQDTALFHKIEKGLEFWHNRNPWCHNWWYNQIAEPQCLSLLLIQMRTGSQQLPSELEGKLLERIKTDGGNPAKWTGANRTDIALHWIYRSCLSQNQTDLEIALKNAYSPLAYTTKEGFQHDNSYFQHGVQLYIGGYGDEILKGITQIAMYTKGTPYAIPEDQLAILSKFMRETYYATIRGQHMMFDVLGRGVSRPGVTQKKHTALFAQRMIELDPTHADEYKAIIKRLKKEEPASYAITPRHTHFFRGDYTLHTRPQYMVDVRTVSTRTMRCEYGNGENLKTYFMSDGCTNITVDGSEYANIFPVWNWTRIPGTTAPQLKKVPMAKSDWQTRGTSTFAGGVSDTLYGVSAYSYLDQYANINTGAQKAWFFFDDEIVCLGAGIRSTSEAPINTTINQCLLSDEKVTIASNRKVSEIANGSSEYTAPSWILHRQVGYVFPKGGSVFVNIQKQEGSWYDINQTASKDLKQAEVFTVGFDHGLQPTDGSYAYILLPGKKTVKEMKAYEKKKNIDILMNTSKMQIVHHKKLNIWQLVFYTAGEFKNKEVSVKVDKGCILMIRDLDKHTAIVHVADPEQKETIIKLEIGLPKKSSNTQTIDCDFQHSGVYAGASQSHKLQF